MELIAQVQQTNLDGTAQIIRIPEESCSGNCSLCGGCGEAKPMVVQNTIGAKVGDRVILHADAKTARKTAIMLYTIPPALLLTGYLLGEHFLSKGGFFGVLGGVIGLWLVLMLDRKLTKKQPYTYEITGFAETA